jgi:hypothetical protein
MIKIVKQFERVIFEPVAIDELKLFLKIDHDADDETLDRTRKAARQWVEAFTSRNWAEKEVTYAIKDVENFVEVPGFEFVELRDAQNNLVVPVKTEVFKGVTVFADFNKDEIYRLTVKDGSQSPPEAITEAIKKLASLYYFEREATGSGTQDLKTLLMPFKKFLFV